MRVVLCKAFAIIVVAVGLAGCESALNGIFGVDLIAQAITVTVGEDGTASISAEVENNRKIRTAFDYAIEFCPGYPLDSEFAAEVYRGQLTLERDTATTIELQIQSHIQPYVDENRILIGPGNYYAVLILDPSNLVEETSEQNNSAESDNAFFYGGGSEVSYFEVDIEYSGDTQVDEQTPLRIIIGDFPDTPLAESNIWGIDPGRFTATTTGTHYFLLFDVPNKDVDDSGYFLLVVHDAGADFEPGWELNADDVLAVYRSGGDNLVYGAVSATCGSPIFPKQPVGFDLHRPDLPAADAYEPDDVEYLGVPLDYASDLPALQNRTFHDTGTGEANSDWAIVVVPDGGTLTAETFSAGGLWESDTWLDLWWRNPEMEKLASNNNKTGFDQYSRVEYTNDTGDALEVYIMVSMAYTSPSPVGEYVLRIDY